MLGGALVTVIGHLFVPGHNRLTTQAVMGNDDLLTDDYVADLLAKEASDCSIKYSALGMEAFRSDKKYVLMRYQS